MIKRIWHGWTRPENAKAYEALLTDEIFPGIAAKNLPGYRGIELLRREQEDLVEFITIMCFDSIESISAFVGDEPTVSYVPEKARRLLERHDSHSQHYELIESIVY